MATNKVSYLWLLTGTQEIFQCDVPPTIKGTTKADCHYHDVVDLRSGHVIGTAIDSSADAENVGDITVVTGTTFFTITTPELSGTLAVRAQGALAPHPLAANTSFSIQGIDLDVPPAQVTHFAAITPRGGENNVLSGTGHFAGASGRFALFGQLDLSQPGSAAFNCVFHLQLELPA